MKLILLQKLINFHPKRLN